MCCFVVEDQGERKGENWSLYTILVVDGRENVVGGDFKEINRVFRELAESSEGLPESQGTLLRPR